MNQRPTHSLWPATLAMCSLCAVGANSPALGQGAPPQANSAPIASAAPAIDAADAQKVRLAAATRLARLGVLYVRQLKNPTPDDYRIGAMLLDEARLMAPNDEEILRRCLEAWDAAGDDKAVIESTKRLLALNPKDTVAQLRLISSRIRMQQDAESRMALYDRLLGPEGVKLDPSIRSRLALDDAMLARERGDDARFARRVAEATSLDATNKNAAVLAATYSLPSTTDPIARLELLVNVLLADPLDISAHLSLARELMSNGAFQGASRFFARAADLYAANRSGREEAVRADMSLSAWAVDGAEVQLARMEDDDKVTRYLLDRQRKAAEQSGEDPSKVPEFVTIPALDVVHLLIATALDQDAVMAQVMARCSKSLDDELEKLAGRVEKGEIEKEEAQETSRRLRSDMLWLRLWTGLDTDKAIADFGDLSEHMTPDARVRYEGWIALRQGAPAKGLDILAQVAETDLRAQIGVGVAAELLGDARAASSVYARVALAEPGVQPYPALPLGLWSKARIEHLLGEKVRPPASAKALEDYVARVPAALDDMTKSPRAFMQLDAHHMIEKAEALDRDDVTISLRNTSPFPLALGESAPLNSSLLLSPRLLVQGKQMLREPQPEIVSLERRLRLLPGETITVLAWADGGPVGTLLDQIAGKLITLRWGLIQGFRLEDSGAFSQGPLCLSTETELQSRRYPGDPKQPIEEMLAALKTEHGSKLLEHVLYCNWRMLQVLEEQARAAIAEAPDDRASQGAALETARLHATELRSQIALALADRLATMTPDERLVTLTVVPPSSMRDSNGHQWDECKPFDDAARNFHDRPFRMAALLLRAPSAEDPELEKTIAGDDPVLSRYASLLLDRRKRDSVKPPTTEPTPEPTPETAPETSAK